MKRTKRILALFLAAMMTLAMGMTSLAAQTGKLTVKVDPDTNNTLTNQTVSIYRLFDLTVSGTDTDKAYAYTVNPKYEEVLREVLNLQDTATDQDYYDAVAAKKDDIQAFAKDFTKALLKQDPAIGADDKKEKIAEGTTEISFDAIDYGYYLVHQTGTKELQSSLVSLDDAELEITLKGKAPSITKTADKDTVEIGQVITYTITGTVPDTTSYAKYVYKLHDTLTDGLDFVDDANGTAVTGNQVNVTIAFKDNTTPTNAAPTKATLSGTDNRTMELDLSTWIRGESAANVGKEFTVTYYAKVNEKAVVTEKNSATLEYGNTQDTITETTPVEVKTPTFPLQVEKTNADGSKTLAGAIFRLYETEQDAKGDKNPIPVTGAAGVYTVDRTSTNYDMTTAAAELEAQKGYNLKLNGLKEGTYWLVETTAPEGYNKLTAPVKVTITKSADDNVDNWTLTQGTDTTPITNKVIEIINTTGTILPGTGGMGTVIFTVAAVVLILGVAVSFIISRRRA